MELPPNRQEVISTFEVPKDAPISYEDYLDYLLDFRLYHGVDAYDVHHAFFAWLQYKYPELQDIDGVSIADLYEVNVYKHEMSPEHFLSVYLPTLYEDFPALLKISDAAASVEADGDLRTHMEFAEERYVAMAESFNLDISEANALRFYDKDGQPHDLFTDPVRRGISLHEETNI